MERFLIDTGSGFDLISHESFIKSGKKAIKGKMSITFNTANGPKIADKSTKLYIDEYGEEAEPIIMGKCPNVLSVGLRASTKNNNHCSSVWVAGKTPFTVLPNGKIIKY